MATSISSPKTCSVCMEPAEHMLFSAACFRAGVTPVPHVICQPCLDEYKTKTHILRCPWCRSDWQKTQWFDVGEFQTHADRFVGRPLPLPSPEPRSSDDEMSEAADEMSQADEDSSYEPVPFPDLAVGDATRGAATRPVELYATRASGADGFFAMRWTPPTPPRARQSSDQTTTTTTTTSTPTGFTFFAPDTTTGAPRPRPIDALPVAAAPPLIPAPPPIPRSEPSQPVAASAPSVTAASRLSPVDAQHSFHGPQQPATPALPALETGQARILRGFVESLQRCCEECLTRMTSVDPEGRVVIGPGSAPFMACSAGCQMIIDLIHTNAVAMARAIHRLESTRTSPRHATTVPTPVAVPLPPRHIHTTPALAPIRPPPPFIFTADPIRSTVPSRRPFDEVGKNESGEEAQGHSATVDNERHFAGVQTRATTMPDVGERRSATPTTQPLTGRLTLAGNKRMSWCPEVRLCRPCTRYQQLRAALPPGAPAPRSTGRCEDTPPEVIDAAKRAKTDAPSA
jgi:hypothetical protein